MNEFTFATAVRRGQCNLQEFPAPWFVDIADDDGAPCGSEHGDEQEKMDMLWEDFNEELTRTPPVCPLSPLNKGDIMTMMKATAWLDNVDDNGDVSSTGKRGKHLVVRRRRWSLLLMLRLVKKLFLVKKSRNQRTAPI